MTGKNFWKPDFLTQADLASVSATVAKVEESTDGEIVPMLVSRSAPGRTAEWLAAALLFLMTEPILMYFDFTPNLMLIATGIAAFVSVLLPAPLFRMFPGLHRRLLHPDDLTLAVEARAMLELENMRVRHTHKRTGILIFVSWFERKAVVLGDEGIAKKITPELWQKLVTELAQDMKSGSVKTGFEKAITSAGVLLTEHFPASAHNPNEIRNDLIIRD